jgi:hypothetical protein
MSPMTTERMTEGDAPPMPWSAVEERLVHPERPRTYWLATTRRQGRPHVMPLIAGWIDSALYFLTGLTSQKGRNLERDPRCVISTGSTSLPSIDIILEGEAVRVTESAELDRAVEFFSTVMEWPQLEVRDGLVHGPNAPTAGPPPYALFRFSPATVYGLPGMTGMEEFESSELPVPTRWRF